MILGNNQFIYFQKVLFSFESTMWCPSTVQPVCRIFGLFGLNMVFLNWVCLSSLSWWSSDIISGEIFEFISMFFFPGLHASRATNSKTARSFCTTWWTRYEWRKQKYVHDTWQHEVCTQLTVVASDFCETFVEFFKFMLLTCLWQMKHAEFLCCALSSINFRKYIFDGLTLEIGWEMFASVYSGVQVRPDTLNSAQVPRIFATGFSFFW